METAIAQDLMTQGRRMIEPDSFIEKLYSYFKSSYSINESALYRFTDALTLFKKCKNYSEIINCYKTISETLINMELYSSAADIYVELYDFIVSSDAMKSIEPLVLASDIYEREGFPNKGAACQVKIGNFYEQGLGVDGKNIQLAIKHYENALELYKLSNFVNTNVLRTLINIANLETDLLKSASLFKSVAELCTNRYVAKPYYFESMLCHIAAGDLKGAMDELEKFQNITIIYRESQEAIAIKELSTAVDNKDETLFAAVTQRNSGYLALDDYTYMLFARIHNNIVLSLALSTSLYSMSYNKLGNIEIKPASESILVSGIVKRAGLI